MKDKVLVFIIGLLIGAVITASGFLIYENANNKNTNQMPNGEQMQMMEKPDGEPPEKPNGAENDIDRPEPPSNNNSSTNNKTN